MADKKSLILFAVLLLSITVHAIKPKRFLAGGDDIKASKLSIYGGGATSLMIHGSFGDFVDSYNSYNGSSGVNILEEDLKNFRFAYGYRYGVRLILPMGVGFSFNYERLYSHTSVGIKTDNRRHFRHITNTPTMGFILDKPKFRFQYNIGFCLPIIESYYEYPDGTISTGKERLLNGVYKGVSACMNFEIAYKKTLSDHLQLEAGAQLNMFAMGEYIESNWERSLVYVSNYGFVYPTALPTDYAAYSSTSWDKYNEENTVKAKAIMPGVFIQLVYTR
ncbi:MAG: hypothetical protein L6Q81_02275 [Bacteroidia bacterium]|nr:hypothetical protein [Bacteroidia bacterium]